MIEPALFERPIAHRPGVNMDETGPRIPTDAAAFHRTCDPHRLLEPPVKADVERPAIEVLAVIRDAECGAGQRSVCGDPTVG